MLMVPFSCWCFPVLLMSQPVEVQVLEQVQQDVMPVSNPRSLRDLGKLIAHKINHLIHRFLASWSIEWIQLTNFEASKQVLNWCSTE